MRRYALKFGYDGRFFHGFQRQPGVRTVEGDIIVAMKSTGIIKNFKIARFSSASRTDKGVSALGNVLAVNTSFRKNEIVQALNAKLNDIWFYKIAEVELDFKPRHAIQRKYRYILPEKGRNIGRLEKAAALFVGKHDFFNFSYNVAGKNTIREINKISINKNKATMITNNIRTRSVIPAGIVTIDFEAPSFLWGMIRMLVAAMMEYEMGNTSLDEIKMGLDYSQRYNIDRKMCDDKQKSPKRNRGKAIFGVAPPEGLILMNVDYDLSFENAHTGTKPICDIETRSWTSVLNYFYYTKMAERIAGLN